MNIYVECNSNILKCYRESFLSVYCDIYSNNKNVSLQPHFVLLLSLLIKMK